MKYARPAALVAVVAAVTVALLLAQGTIAQPAALRSALDSAANRSRSDGAPASTSAVQPSPTAPSVQVTLLEETVKQYGRLKLSAQGLAPGETAVVTAKPEGDAHPVELGEAQADVEGRVTEFGADLPEAITSGSRTITVAGRDSGRLGTATLFVRSEKLFAVLSSYTLRPGDKLGFVAGGFEPESDVTASLGTGGTPVATMRADRAGNTEWMEVKMPVVTPGEYELVFQDSQGQNRHVQRITVSPLEPTLELSPWSGPPGTTIELNGRGFLPDEEVQVFVGRNPQPVSSFKADQYGNYWGIGPLGVPLDSGGGPAEVRLVGQTSGAEVSQGFAVVGVKPWGELSAYSGMPGTAVRFSGGGFAAKERVTIHLGNASGPVVGTAQTDEQGNVVRSSATSVPGDVADRGQTSVTFTFVGDSSGGQASAVFTVIYPFVPEVPRELPRRP